MPESKPDWLLRLHSPPPKPNNKSLPDPPGYAPLSKAKSSSKQSQTTTAVRKPPTPEEMDALKLKKAWELALGPAKQLPMNAIGMYMTGNTLQIFSIMMVFMLFKTPITAILGLNTAFARFESGGNRDKILLAKIAYVLTNCGLLALGIWKVNAMGLLP
jgi:ER membrane protein complex subunit 4